MGPLDRSLEKWVVMTQEQWSHYSVPPTENTCQGTGRGHYLGVLVDLGEVLLIAVDVQSDGGARTPSAAQSKDDARTVCENDPQALEKRTEIFFLACWRDTEAWVIMRGPLGDLISSILDPSEIRSLRNSHGRAG